MPLTKHQFFTALVLLMIVLLTALGLWQLQRRVWKENLIQARQAALHSDPIELIPERLDPKDIRKVNLTGTLLHPFIRLYAQGTYQRIHPLVLPDGQVLYVNLGTENLFPVPQDPKTDVPLINVTALLHAPTAVNAFTPANSIEKQQWYHLNLSDLNTSFGQRGLPFIATALTSIDPSLTPLDPDRFLDLPNNHLVYAITWFSLALMLGVLLMIFMSRGTTNARLPKA